MSKFTVKELDELAAKGEYEKEVVEVSTYRQVAKPWVLRKVCPVCKRVFDRFLICGGPAIGCRSCVEKQLKDLGIEIAKEKLKDAAASLDDLS
jgi:hypothetical protein